MAEQPKPSKATTEKSTNVLNEVKGRLERMEAGDMPVIERIGPDGTSRRVDQTGEMIRPDATRVAAVNEAAEQFASQHQAAAADSPQVPAVPSTSPKSPASEQPRQGLWERIKSWFRRD